MTRYQFDAYEAFRGLRARYTDFLLEHFRVPPGALARHLRQHWGADGSDPFRLFAPLLVEGTFPFRPGVAVCDLVSPKPPAQNPERPLHPKTADLLERAGFREPLYEHQVQAIRAGSVGRTVILSAGTGSGKTEAFLIPLIDRLFWAEARGEDDLSIPGVRAIVVYPLNALVNNQVERVAKLLEGQSRVTFAYYTSRLKEKYTQARATYETQGKHPPPTCQIIDRRTLRGLDGGEGRPAGPPHILITNFSMLEYMLIRAADRTIFEPTRVFHRGRPRLGAIVLDEAHVYSGSQAAEIHMLLRRAAHRFGTRLEDIQGFATSATLSRSESPEVEIEILAKFGGDMFRSASSDLEALVGRRHLPDEEASGPRSTASLAPPASLLEGPLVAPELRTLVYDPEGSPVAFLKDAHLARLAGDACVPLGLATRADVSALAGCESPAELLHRLLSMHPQMIALRRWLFEAAELPTLDEVGSFLYGEGPPSEAQRRAVDAVLRLGSLARSAPKRLPFIPTRMHAMLRAPAGVWVDPRSSRTPSTEEGAGEETWPWGALHSVPGTGAPDEPPRLPLRLCSKCGAAFLEAWQSADDLGVSALLAAPTSEDDKRVLLRHDRAGPDRMPESLGGASVRILDVVRRRRNDLDVTCPSCGDARARARLLEMSPRAALGAVVDAVYPHLNEHPRPASGGEILPGGGRRILSFSDSRQGTARVAVEVEETHDIGIVRRLLWDTIRKRGERVRVRDLIEEDLVGHPLLRARAAAADLPDDLLDDLARVSVYQELSRPPADAVNLETMGLIEIVYPKLPPPPVGFALSDAEWRALLSIILDDARRRGVVAFPVVARDEYQLHELVERNLGKRLVFQPGQPDNAEDARDAEEDDRGTDVAIVPTHRERSRLVDFATRVAALVGGCDPIEILRSGWDALRTLGQDPSCRWLKAGDADAFGLVVHFEHLDLLAHDAPTLVRPASRRLHFRTVRGVVPERGATDTARPLTEDERSAWRQRHAVRRVLDDLPLALWSVEHTAQVETDDLERQETLFRAGMRNLLASSTTMEMGVDLGGLTFIMMTNVPPSPSNYWQRAGRAGRRADGSSMALTLALPRPHDQRVFTDLRQFLLGPVVPPVVRLDAAPLVRRHLHAFLLGAFLEDSLPRAGGGNPLKAFGTVGEFLFEPAGGLRFSAAVANTLGVDPKEPLARAFTRWLGALDLPDSTAACIPILVAGTALAALTPRQIAATAADAFEAAIAIADHDRRVIREQRTAEEGKGEGAQDEAYLRALEYQDKDLSSEHMVAYLARTSFFPRFGFPVDLVHLETRWQNRPRSGSDERPVVPDLRMERALDVALGEYAPGSEVIAGKRVHKVAGLIRNWMSDDVGRLHRRFFFECLRCGGVHDGQAEPSSCQICGHPTQREEAFFEDARAAARQGSGRGRPAVEDLGPSPLRKYFQPSSFAVQLGVPPRRLGGEVHRMPPSRVVLATAGGPVASVVPDAVSCGFAPESRIFVRSEGDCAYPGAPGYGYAICQRCGRAEPERGWGGRSPKAMHRHRRLRGSGLCPGDPQLWRNAVLGTSATVDVFRVRLQGDFAPRVLDDEQEPFYLTLAICLQQVAASQLQVDSRTLKPTLGTWHDGSHGREAAIYDDSASGVLARLAEDPLRTILDVVELLDVRMDGDFIGFETQFLAMQRKVRVDLVRAHFLDPARRQRLEWAVAPAPTP